MENILIHLHARFNETEKDLLAWYTHMVYHGEVITVVVLTKAAEKDLKKVPQHVATKLMAWVEAVERDGLENIRRIPGFHDEPLRGERKGQRSIRLTRSYRAIYVIKETLIEFVSVEEVHKHEY